MEQASKRPVTLIDLLNNSILLRQTAPYIPVKDLLRFSQTCKTIRELVFSLPEVWRHLDLTGIKRAIIHVTPIDVGGFSWRNERMDESLTEDDFYAGPLRGIFGKLNSKRILKFVHTLVLNGLTVPTDLVREIVSEDRYQVRVLSIRGAKQLNIAKLNGALRYIVRPTRREGTPTLKALYVFGSQDASQYHVAPHVHTQAGASLGVMGAQGAQIGAAWNQKSSQDLESRLNDDEAKWYGCNGRVLRRPYMEWADTLQVCKDIIHFDAVLCRGPRHDITKVDSKDFLQPTIATIALGPHGCETCHSSPEGPAIFGQSAEHALPLLGPVPSHSSTVRAAVRPEQQTDGSFPRLFLRCEDCLRSRWCEQCNRWWCEDCYNEPPSRAAQQAELRQELQSQGWTTASNATSVKAGLKRDCFACGFTCAHCAAALIRSCQVCKSEYCLPHEEKCNELRCGWCNHSGRRNRVVPDL